MAEQGLLQKQSDGSWLRIAGLNGQSGELVIGASKVQSGTWTNTSELNIGAYQDVFIPFPEAFEGDLENLMLNAYTNNYTVSFCYKAKSLTGMTIGIVREVGNDIPAGSLTIAWTAAMLYSSADMANVQAALPPISALDTDSEKAVNSTAVQAAINSLGLTPSVVALTVNSSVIASGAMTARVSGNIMIVQMYGIQFVSDVTLSNGIIIATGLPKAPVQQACSLVGSNLSVDAHFLAAAGGGDPNSNSVLLFGAYNINSSYAFYGTIVCIV